MSADPDLIALFARGWAMTRNLAAPVTIEGGHYIVVGQPDQKARYVFPRLDGDRLAALAGSIGEPFVYLKVCDAPEAVRAALPAQWIIREPPTYMMTARLQATPVEAPPGYAVTVEAAGALRQARICHGGEEVARGRIALLGTTALFDQVSTDEAHRRKGLGRLLMQVLAREAFEQGAPKGLLSATEMGRWLYETIGWIVHAPYTSAVIPI